VRHFVNLHAVSADPHLSTFTAPGGRGLLNASLRAFDECEMPKLGFDLGLQRNGGNVRPGFLESSGLLGRSARDLHELFGKGGPLLDCHGWWVMALMALTGRVDYHQVACDDDVGFLVEEPLCGCPRLLGTREGGHSNRFPLVFFLTGRSSTPVSCMKRGAALKGGGSISSDPQPN
jgi:hypothetical protein